jgi:hypothetical protein
MGGIVRSLTESNALWVSDEKRPYLCCASPKIQREGGLLAPKLDFLASRRTAERLQLWTIIMVAQCAMWMQRRHGGGIFCEGRERR